MAKIASAELRRLAIVGARARLQELQGEIAALVSAFPEIGRAGARPVVTTIKRRKPGRKTPMTAAERKEVSERMKRYWAAVGPQRAPRSRGAFPLVAAITLIVNGTSHQVDVAADVPLLYVLRNNLELRGPQFGCGLAQCGACSVLVDGKEERSCMWPATAVAGKQITTLEGLPARWASQRKLTG